MKNYKIKIGLLTLILIFVTACGDDYYDVNTPSETADASQLRINDLIGPVLTSTLEAQRSAELTFGNYVQNFVGQGGSAAGETQATGLWNEVYLEILPNIKVIKEKAAAGNATHFNAIADIITAINLGILTDSWGNIPFSEASLGEENLLPAFDTQEQVYNKIFELLNSAIAQLEAPDTANDDILGVDEGGDLIYEGDIEKWTKAAYTLKARYQLHLINKGVSPNEVLASIANGFTSNSDDFQLVYSGSINLNPWYLSEVQAVVSGNPHRDIASHLVSTMNGDNYPFNEMFTDTIITNEIEPFDPINNDTAFFRTVDPRLPLYVSNDGDPDWKGFVSGGEGLAPDGSTPNTIFAEGGYYTSENSPLVLISYAEAMFIKAEAAFLANGGNETSVGSNATAYTAYIDGINASMNKLGVDGNDYMDDMAVNVGEGSLMLNHIMKEKYIHNFLNPETFVDFRRYNFSDNVFVGLTIREEADPGDFEGEWFRRASYPASELARNPLNVEANQQSPITSVWWEN